MRVLLTIAGFVLLAALFAAFSVVWGALFLLALLSRWKLIPQAIRRGIGTLALIAAAGLLLLAPMSPSHPLQSMTQSNLRWVGPILNVTPESYRQADKPPQFDEMVEARREFGLEIRQLRLQLNAVERALALQAYAEKLISFNRDANLQFDDLINARTSVNASLDRKKLDSIADLKRVQKNIEDFIKATEQEFATRTTPQQAKEFLIDFRLRSRGISMADIQDQVLKLESAINQLQRKAIAENFRVERAWLGATLDEGNNRIKKRQVITLLATKLQIRQLDASELMLDHEPEALDDVLSVSYGSVDDAKPVSAPDKITVSQGMPKITLVKDATVPAHLMPVATPWQLFSFKSFIVRWSAPVPVKMRAILDLSPLGGPKELPYSFDIPPDPPIDSLILPANAYYTSSQAFKEPRIEGGNEVFEPDGELRPSHFLARDHIWIELMPDSWIFRNSTVQGLKAYLIPENLFAGLAVILIGAICASLF